jgi:hypothetical protein
VRSASTMNSNLEEYLEGQEVQVEESVLLPASFVQLP